MKSWKIILLTLILLFINGVAYANSSNNIDVIMNGKTTKVVEVPVIVDGQALKSEVPSFIHIDRTLVPVRFVAEEFGAEVKWDQKTKTATILHGEKQIELTIDSPRVSINNSPKVLDKNSIPKLITFSNKDARTMVPLAFISEALGYEVGWDEVKRVPYINTPKKEEEKPKEDPKEDPIEKPKTSSIIKQISVSKGSTENNKIVIDSDRELKYKTTYINISKKLILDIEDAVLNIPGSGGTPNKINVNNGIVKQVEYSQYTTKPNVTRVVLTLEKEMDYDILNNKQGLVISFVNKIKPIKMEKVDGNAAIVIEGNHEIKYNVMKLKSPERIVIDIMDSSLESGNYFNYSCDLGFIKGIRISQFEPDNLYSPLDRIVRVVLDAKDGVTDANVKIDNVDNKLIIFPEKSFWENIDYKLEGRNRLITIDNEYETDYSIEYDPVQKIMELEIPNGASKLQEGKVIIKDGLIEEIEIIKETNDTKILIQFRTPIEYNLLSNTKDKEIKLSIKKDSDIKPSDRLIVIDPGHGGGAPGAISPNGTREKDVNLDISKKLNQQLIKSGYNTIMTRDTDVDVDLYERARIANNVHADIFVSIHSNAIANNTSVSGIEVLYCPAGQSQKKEEDQSPLAKTVLDELIKITGANNRGIVSRPKIVVLRETNMPAILVEVGFLTNPAEEKLITTESYQYKIVDGIIKGIEKYFEMY